MRGRRRSTTGKRLAPTLATFLGGDLPRSWRLHLRFVQVAWLVAACLIWRDPRSLGAGRAFAVPEAEAAGAVLCLKCGYALTGLREARCPECGEAYTLDALFAAQPGRDRRDLDGRGAT